MKFNNRFIKIDNNKEKINNLKLCTFIRLNIYYIIYNIFPELNDLNKTKEIMVYLNFII